MSYSCSDFVDDVIGILERHHAVGELPGDDPQEQARIVLPIIEAAIHAYQDNVDRQAREQAEWSGSPDPSDPDNYWINDETGERVAAANDAPDAKKPVYYSCGGCDHYHSALWDGDCRQDDARFTSEDLDAMHPNGWNEIDMDDIDDWRAGRVKMID